MRAENLFDGIPTELPKELFTTLHRDDGLRIERIVSHGHCSLARGWYEQDGLEWVALLSGAATLAFAGGDEVSLRPGDYLLIPAGCRHRVAWTAPGEDTVWLAVHLPPGDD